MPGTPRVATHVRPRGPAPPLRAALLLAAVALSTGIGLVVYFLSGLSLPIGIGVAAVVTTGAAWLTWRRLDVRQRAVVRRRAWAGVRAGLLATVAYDLTRFLVVWVFGLQVRPWAALPLFGQLLVDVPPDSAPAFAVGLAYHVVNGTCFAVAYSVVAAPRGLLTGIAFALGLEACMLAFYPGWLDIRAIGEFFSMTILGHVAYGAVLGVLARRWSR